MGLFSLIFPKAYEPKSDVIEAEIVSETSDDSIHIKAFDIDTDNIRNQLLKKIVISMYRNPSFWKYDFDHKWIISTDSWFTITENLIFVKPSNWEKIELTYDEKVIVRRLIEWFLSINKSSIDIEKQKHDKKRIEALLDGLDRL